MEGGRKDGFGYEKTTTGGGSSETVSELDELVPPSTPFRRR